MSLTFTKLFSGLTESTVWVEPYPTRILWVSMLSWADQHGRIYGSVPGIARRAGINLDEAEAALVSFMSPDRHSRTPDHDGRRIEKIDGGWRLINYAKYRELRDADVRREQNREAQRRHRERLAQAVENQPNPCGLSAETVSNGADNAENKPRSAQAEAEAEEEKAKNHLVGLAPDDAHSAGARQAKAARREAAGRILEFLNGKANRAFRAVDATLKPIMARLDEGATEGQCRQVIAKKLSQWAGDSRMEPFLRPATLFARENFWNYAGELVVPRDEEVR